jgi:hypothetical protein
MNYTLDNYNKLRYENINLKSRIIKIHNCCIIPNMLKSIYIQKYLTIFKNNSYEIEEYLNYIYLYYYICNDTYIMPSLEIKLQIHNDIKDNSEFLSTFNLNEPLIQSNYV